MLNVEKTDRFMLDLDDVVIFIAQDNVDAAIALQDRIHQQVDSLADPNFPRRKGRKAGTLELVAHPSYIVVFEQTDTTVTVFNLLHTARQYP
ncbi:MAG: type II toxin-antitoxin system RelE/ParE family toxin [Rhodoferax sp.]|nr:type II toxin-antitoxin system RelE/ParE family toxin [Rhodoferax sp.]